MFPNTGVFPKIPIEPSDTHGKLPKTRPTISFFE